MKSTMFLHQLLWIFLKTWRLTINVHNAPNPLEDDSSRSGSLYLLIKVCLPSPPISDDYPYHDPIVEDAYVLEPKLGMH